MLIRMGNADICGKVFFYFSILFFRGLLDFAYYLFVSPLYTYARFDFNFDFASYFFSWVCLVVALLFVNERLRKVSDYFFVIAVLGVLAPITSLYGLSSRGTFPVIVSISAIAIMYLIVNSKYTKAPKLPFIKGGGSVAVFFSAIMVSVVVVWYFVSGAVQYFNLNLMEVYEYRELSAEAARVGIMSYVNGWVYGVFSVFLFSYALLKRNFFLALILLAVQVFFFGVSAHKSVLFYPFMVFGIWFYFRKTDKLIIVPILFSSVVVFSLLSWMVIDNPIPASLFIRRVFYIPSLLTYDYFSFFQDSERIFWSNSILSEFFEYPYSVGLTALIGEYNRTNATSNNGFISSGYAHAGLLGVFLYSIVFAIFLSWIDNFSKSLPVWFALAIMVVPYRSALISSDLLTVMLTHGLLIAAVLLLLLRANQKKWDKESGLFKVRRINWIQLCSPK